MVNEGYQVPHEQFKNSKIRAIFAIQAFDSNCCESKEIEFRTT